jgi:hypothetical protein
MFFFKFIVGAPALESERYSEVRCTRELIITTASYDIVDVLFVTAICFFWCHATVLVEVNAWLIETKSHTIVLISRDRGLVAWICITVVRHSWEV